MKLSLPGLELNYEYYFAEANALAEILLLHGYTGSSNDWNFLIPSLKKNYNIITLDFIGHGKSDSPVNPDLYTIQSLVSHIDKLKDKLKLNRLILLGYSMGGRIALSYAAAFPDKVYSLIIESTTWGLKDESLRKRRITEDEKVAEFILTNDLEKFVDLWMNKDIFKSQKALPKTLLENIKKSKLQNDSNGLANSLRGSGTGKMPPLHNLIKNIRVPVLQITGQLDVKFTNINLEMKKIFPNPRHEIISGAGHNVHLEKPDKYINVINDFLKDINFFNFEV